MAIQFVIIHNGTGYDVSNMFEEITWSGRKGAAPRSVSITLMDDDGYNHSRVTVDCANGDQCVFYEGGKELFRGIITSHKQSNSKKLVVKAYDNAYYLANNKDSFCYTNKTATDIFNDCMSRLGMTGNAVDTSYVIPELPKAKTTYYDVMLDALSTTYKATGERYYISSENGTIYLRKRVENAMQWVLEAGSSQSNLTSYEYSKSIEKIRKEVAAMSKETLFEKLGVKYIEKDDIFYPLITLGGEEKNIDVGKYGHMWIDYIRTEYPQRYKSLVRFGELHDKAAEVNEVAYELLEDIEKEWLGEHKPKQANSFVEMYRLRTQARMIAEEVVLHDVVNCFH